MKVMLQARGLWEVVNFGTIDFHEDRLALEAILRAVPPEMVGNFTGKSSAKMAWEVIKAHQK